MALLNVNRDVKDQFYRYKMPSILAKVEGKGNGIKTVIVNMVDIAKALGRPPTYACKYFGCELGAQTQFDIKNDRYIVNGSHDAPKLQDLLDTFIKKYVLCQQCDNPETTLVVKKGTIGLICKACGDQSMADLRHKLCTYMIKNPPQSFGKENSGGTKTKKEQKKGRERESKEHSSEEDTNHNNHNHKQQNGKHPKQNKEKKQNVKDDDDDDWAVDVSAEAVAARMQEITSGAKVMTLNDDLEKTPSERADLLYTLVKTRVDDGTILKADKEIVAESERLDIRNKAPLILVEVLFNQNMREQIRTYKNHFLRLCHGNVKAQKSLMGAVEKMIELHQDVLLPKVMHILKELYDLDIVDEEVMLEWGEKPSKKYVTKELSRAIHEKAAPFIKWLKEAEEESSDEEDEVEIVYTSKSEQQLKREEEAGKQKEKADMENVNGGDEDDDFDIEDI
ncbi:eukaryotic translation initiation factor 5-like [Styela clava]